MSLTLCNLEKKLTFVLEIMLIHVKISITNKQLELFTTAFPLMCKRESKQYVDEKEWHMLFYRNVTCSIEVEVSCPLFVENIDCTTKAIQQLEATGILKEGAVCSDETLCETAAITCFGVPHLDFSVSMVNA